MRHDQKTKNHNISRFGPSLVRKSIHFGLTLISAVVEDIEGIHGLFTSLLVTKDQVNPLMEVTGNVLTFLEFKIQVIVILNSCLNTVW